MNNFDMKVEILYQLCRKAHKIQSKEPVVYFSIAKYDVGQSLTISIHCDNDIKMYSIVENGYEEEENFEEAKEHLEKILMEGKEND